MFANRFSVTAKLFLPPAIAAIGLIITILTSHIGSQHMAQNAHDMLTQSDKNAADINELNTTLERVVSLVKSAPSEIDLDRLAASRAEFSEKVVALEAMLAERIADAEGIVLTDMAQLSEAGIAVFDFAAQFAQVQALEVVDGAFSAAAAAVTEDVEVFKVKLHELSEALLDEITVEREITQNRILVAGALSLLAAVGISLMIGRNMSRRMKGLQTRMSQIAEGDMGGPIADTDARDELGKMAAALQIFRDGLIEKAELLKQNAKRQKAEEAAAEDARRAAHDAEEQERQRIDAEARAKAERDARAAQEKEALRAEAERERQAIHDELAGVMSGLGDGLKKLASGQLDAEIFADFPDNYKAVRSDFNTAVQNLKEIVSLISASGLEISDVSDEVSEATAALAKRTESNAASLEEAAAGLNQLTKAVAMANEETQAASQLAETTEQQAEKGAQVVTDTVTAMEKIQSSSVKISSIVEVIEGISFQTNLLALNAGVEAARAGEAGRGFAVVATEVRALAQRSSEAAKEISALIEEEAANVEQGVGLAKMAGTSLQEITKAVSAMNARITTITDAANSQSAGITEINGTVIQIDQSTQQYAAMFEETNAATQVLKQHSNDLRGAISRFSMGHDTSALAAE
ncbi:MAG: methyl-accepting chemotaxis protein [Pseudomonadota bacterium]